MAIPCHIVVEGIPAIIYASRNGTPEKVLRILRPFLNKFWDERETSGEDRDTPECLLAQLVVRLGYEICEDDFSNLKVSMKYDPEVEYLYRVALDRTLSIWSPESGYRSDASLGLAGCRQLKAELCGSEEPVQANG